jgi:hypothetical protein
MLPVYTLTYKYGSRADEFQKRAFTVNSDRMLPEIITKFNDEEFLLYMQ